MRGKVASIALVVAGLAIVFYLPGVKSTLIEWAMDRGEEPEPARVVDGERAWYAGGDRYYHRPGCPRLAGRRRVSRQLSELKLLDMRPCPECRPSQ